VDRLLLAPLRYSAGMMLGDRRIGLYGPDTAQAFGHLGFANIFAWADPQRDISVALLTTGKLVLGPHLAALWGLLSRISRHCPTLSPAQQEARLQATGMC
jgi:CubicO group peptidase (beta-lactamase class C family)